MKEETENLINLIKEFDKFLEKLNEAIYKQNDLWDSRWPYEKATFVNFSKWLKGELQKQYSMLEIE